MSDLPSMATDIEIVVGTYEEFLVGYKVEHSKKGDGNYDLHQSFAKRSHTASVRCVANHGRYLASGGADDRIFVINMQTRSEVQIITCHDGTVNTIQFSPDGSHLFSGGSDGCLAATRVGNWITEKTWLKAHNKLSVNCISMHPSGKLALSLGSDLTLRTWNLVKGRQAYTTNLKTKAALGRIVECVVWSPSGEYFLLTGAKVFEVMSSATATVISSVPCDSKPVSACWIGDNVVAVGLESGHVMLFDLEKSDETAKIKAHDTRVKDIARLNNFVATVSSGGDVTLWQYEDMDLTEICTTNIGCRPTCVTMIDLKCFANDYVLKREDSESETEDVAATVTARKIPTSGTVTVEYDDDEQNDEPKSLGKRAKPKQKLATKPAKKQKLDVSRNSSAFIEDDLEVTPVKSTKKNSNVSQSFKEEDVSIEDVKKTVVKAKNVNTSLISHKKTPKKQNTRKSIA